MTRAAVCRLATEGLQLAARSRPSLPVGGRFPSENARMTIIKSRVDETGVSQHQPAN